MSKKIFDKCTMMMLAFSILTVISVAVSIVNFPSYQSIILLPISFVVLLIFLNYTKNNYCYHNIAYMMVLLIFFAKNVVSPFLMSIGGMATLFPRDIEDNLPLATFLMIYEEIVCFFIMYIFSCKKHNFKDKKIHYSNRNARKTFRNIMIILLLICVTLYVLFPSIHKIYRNILTFFEVGKKDNDYDYTLIVSGGTLGRIATTLFVFLFTILRIAFPAYLILRISRKQNLSSFILCLLIIATQFLFIPEAVSSALFTALLLMYLLIEKYPKYRKKTVIVLGILTSSFVIAIFGFSYTTEMGWYDFNSIWEYLSNFSNTYFSGVVGVANSLKIPELTNRFEILFNTFIEALPFRSTWLPQSIDWLTINEIYYQLPMSNGQIIPTISTGNFFFSTFFSPLISAVFVIVSIKYGEKYTNTLNDFKKIGYLYMSFQFALGLGIFNLPITLVHYFQVGVPLLIIGFFAGSNSFKCNKLYKEIR